MLNLIIVYSQSCNSLIFQIMTDEVSEAYASDSVKRSISKCSYQPKKAGKDGYVMIGLFVLLNYYLGL